MTAQIVSHDRRFAAEVGTRFLLVADGGVTELASPDPFYQSLIEPPAPPPQADRGKRQAPLPEPDGVDRVLARILDLEERFLATARPSQVQRQIATLYGLLEWRPPRRPER